MTPASPLDNNATLPGLADRLGVAGLYVYAFTALFSTAAMNLGLAAMVVAAALRWRTFWATFGRRSVFWLVLLFAIYLALRGILAGQEFPNTWAAQQHAGLDLFAVGGLPMLIAALWTGGDAQRIRHTLLLAVAGFLILLSLKQGWASLPAPTGTRMSLDMSPNTLGLIASTLLWGSLAFLVREVSRMSGKHLAYLPLLGLSATALLASVILVLTGSRGAWLASGVMIPPLLVAALWRMQPEGHRRRPMLTLLALLGLMLAITLWAGGDMLEQRIAAANNASESMLASKGESVEDESIGSRLLMWQDATRHIAQRPLLGWGPGSAPMLLGQSAHPQIQKYHHFHNLPLTLLVTLGAVGALLFLAIHGAVILEAVSAYRRNRLSAELFFFAAGGMGIFHIANLFQYRLNDTASQYLLTLVGMIALSALPAPPPMAGHR